MHTTQQAQISSIFESSSPPPIHKYLRKENAQKQSLRKRLYPASLKKKNMQFAIDDTHLNLMYLNIYIFTKSYAPNNLNNIYTYMLNNLPSN